MKQKYHVELNRQEWRLIIERAEPISQQVDCGGTVHRCRRWVRIPSSPPKKSSKLKGLLDFPFLSDSLNFPIFALERR